MDVLTEIDETPLVHLPYNSDLAPLDFRAFTAMNLELQG
jgi:hypothetical protein